MSVDEVRTSKAEELRVVGRRLPRHDARDKIAGATRYAADLALPGMLHARLVRSQMASARLVRRDVEGALAIPGVVAVFLGEDVPNNTVWVDVPGQGREVRALKASMQVLATDRVRYHGEPIALIVAEHEDVLPLAEEAVEIGYEPIPGVFDPDEALRPGAPAVHDGGNLLAEWIVDHGDVEDAFARADLVVEGEYRTQLVDHAYLEPEAGVAWLDDDGVINIRASTQVVEHYRDVARILGVPASQVRVIAPFLGGGFGGKEDMTVEPYLALAVHRLRRPVRMVWTRQESLLARAKRHPMRMRYRTAAAGDGTLLAHDIDITADAGAYAFLSALVLLYAAVTAGGPYRVPAVRLRSRAVYTNNPPTSAMRGFGAMQVVFAYESQIDEVARRLGLDPAEVRRRNALVKGDRLPVGQELRTEVLLADTIDAVTAAAGPRPAPSRPRTRVGRGIASNLQPYGRLVWLNDAASAWVGFELDGSVVVRCGVPDVGGGQAFSLAQIAAELLGVGIERVTVHIGDSARTPLAGTTTATRQLYMSGNAVHLACTELRDRVLGVVASEAGLPPEALSIADGTVVGPGVAVPLPEALSACGRAGVPLHALATFSGPRGREVERRLRSDRVFPDFTFGTHLADVEVDLDTGRVRVLRYLAAHDVGRAINPTSVEGQICGAVAMGIGQALLEEVVVREGVNLTGGLFQYLIPGASDLPDIEPIVLESGEGLGPFGARGIGEPPIGPCAAAIANAIADAVGVRPTVLPITPEQVLACVDRAGLGEGGG
jgi:CO/xanthine dehydrogenase Mo-binding subunit